VKVSDFVNLFLVFQVCNFLKTAIYIFSDEAHDDDVVCEEAEALQEGK
jgi:hypothetical protein